MPEFGVRAGMCVRWPRSGSSRHTQTHQLLINLINLLIRHRKRDGETGGGVSYSLCLREVWLFCLNANNYELKLISLQNHTNTETALTPMIMNRYIFYCIFCTSSQWSYQNLSLWERDTRLIELIGRKVTCIATTTVLFKAINQTERFFLQRIKLGPSLVVIYPQVLHSQVKSE